MGSNIWINQPDSGAKTNEQSKNKLFWKKTTFRFENVVFLSFLIAIWLAAGAATGAPSTALFARVKREYHRKHYRRNDIDLRFAHFGKLILNAATYLFFEN